MATSSRNGYLTPAYKVPSKAVMMKRGNQVIDKKTIISFTGLLYRCNFTSNF
jgi:hypothetical protein